MSVGKALSDCVKVQTDGYQDTGQNHLKFVLTLNRSVTEVANHVN